jgi:hypothetical protein
MTAIGTLVIDRSGMPGSLADLTADTDGFGPYVIAVKGLGRIGITPRETFAAPVPWVHGQLRTAVVKEESALVLLLSVNGSSASDLDTKVTALEDALWQFVYPVTLTVGGVAKVYVAYPATIQSVDGLTTFERATAFFEDLSISIPVYPVSS